MVSTVVGVGVVNANYQIQKVVFEIWDLGA